MLNKWQEQEKTNAQKAGTEISKKMTLVLKLPFHQECALKEFKIAEVFYQVLI